jgi:hypothetical protein
VQREGGEVGIKNAVAARDRAEELQIHLRNPAHACRPRET